jgi:hypothetical protein
MSKINKINRFFSIFKFCFFLIFSLSSHSFTMMLVSKHYELIRYGKVSCNTDFCFNLSKEFNAKHKYV